MSTTPQLEALREEIEAKKKFIALCRGEADVVFLAKHQQILGDKAEQLELLLEAQRRADVVREHEELHSPYTEECPICLEDVRVVAADSMSYFVCCGNGLCKGCADTANASEREGVDVFPNCPMCRADLPNDDAKDQLMARKTEQQAKNGRSWAQFEMAFAFIRAGHSAGKEGALKWLELAMEQRYPPAVALMADIYGGSYGNTILDPSPSKGRALLKEAADLGVYGAQAHLGRMYLSGEGGPVDYEKALFYSTLAYGKDAEKHAVFQLGWLFIYGVGGVSKSLYRAKYYLQEAVEMDDRRACSYLAMILIEICMAQYNRANIPGHSCIPKTLYWARKSVGGDTSTSEMAMKIITSTEEEGKKACAGCRKRAESVPDPLKRCVRCRAAWYCGKQCQQEHWKAGHKIDCIKQE